MFTVSLDNTCHSKRRIRDIHVILFKNVLWNKELLYFINVLYTLILRLSEHLFLQQCEKTLTLFYQGSGTLSTPKCLSENHIVSMSNNFPHPCTMFSCNAILELCTTEKVSTQFQVSQLLVLSLYSIIKSVPDPF